MINYIDIEPNKTFNEIGINQFGQSPFNFSGASVNNKTQSAFASGISSTFLQSGDLIQQLNMVDGFMQSNDFVTGVSGWRIDGDGNIEVNNGTFRGTVTVTKDDGSYSIYSGGDLKFYDSNGNLVILIES